MIERLLSAEGEIYILAVTMLDFLKEEIVRVSGPTWL